MKNFVLAFGLLTASVSFADNVTKTCTVEDSTRAAGLPAETISFTATDEIFNGQAFGGTIQTIIYHHVDSVNGIVTHSDETLYGSIDPNNGFPQFASVTGHDISDFQNDFDKAGMGTANFYAAGVSTTNSQFALELLTFKDREGSFAFNNLPLDGTAIVSRKANILPCP